MDHLLLSCVFARELWLRLLHGLGWERFAPTPESTLSDWWLLNRLQVPEELRKGFNSAVLLVSWQLWKERNARVFNGEAASVAQTALRVYDIGYDWISAGFTALAVLLAT